MLSDPASVLAIGAELKPVFKVARRILFLPLRSVFGSQFVSLSVSLELSRVHQPDLVPDLLRVRSTKRRKLLGNGVAQVTINVHCFVVANQRIYHPASFLRLL